MSIDRRNHDHDSTLSSSVAGSMPPPFSQPFEEYELSSFRLRYMEFVRVARPHQLAALFIWPFGRLGIIHWAPSIIPKFRSVRDSEISGDRVPEFAIPVFEQAFSVSQERGFTDQLLESTHATGSDGDEISSVGLWMRNSDGRILLSCVISRSESGAHQSAMTLISPVDDQRVIATSGENRRFDPLWYSEVQHYPGCSLPQLIELHENRIHRLSRGILTIPDRDSMIEKVDQLNDQFFDSMVQRGVMKKRTAGSQSDASDPNPYAATGIA